MLTVAKAARRLNLAPRTVRAYCHAGRMRGAVRHGRDWIIPDPPVIVGGIRPRGRPRKATA